MDWLWPLNQRWFWKLFFLFLALFILPFIVVGSLLYFAPDYIFLFLILALIALIVYRSYKAWVERRRGDDVEA